MYRNSLAWSEQNSFKLQLERLQRENALLISFLTASLCLSI